MCPDSFKGSLTADKAAEAIGRGAAKARPDAELDLVPLADGGEGTVEAIIDAVGGERVIVRVTGPLGQPVEAFYGIIDNGITAVIEMAAAAGLHLIPETARDPRRTTTRGVGELILHAYERGCRRFIIALGGSATNDGGAGALSELGVRFLDRYGRELPPGGECLVDLAKIDATGMRLDLATVDIRLACDVTNPLIGPTGTSAVYGPQKGASPETVELLDSALANYAAVVKSSLGVDVSDIPGAGAAGGLGAGLAVFLGARIESGIDLVLEATQFEKRLSEADLVITGEGRVDAQTIYGKTVFGVLKRAKAVSVPVVILAGSIGEGTEALYDAGAVGIFSIARGPVSIEESISKADQLLAETAENAVRLFSAGRDALQST